MSCVQMAIKNCSVTVATILHTKSVKLNTCKHLNDSTKEIFEKEETIFSTMFSGVF